MAFRVYSGPRGSEMASPIDKDRMLFKQFAGLDEAMAWARHVQTDGRVVLLIEGDDGTSLSKRELSAALP
jgi:IS5 family transposase